MGWAEMHCQRPSSPPSDWSQCSLVFVSARPKEGDIDLNDTSTCTSTSYESHNLSGPWILAYDFLYHLRSEQHTSKSLMQSSHYTILSPNFHSAKGFGGCDKSPRLEANRGLIDMCELFKDTIRETRWCLADPRWIIICACRRDQIL